MAKRHAEIAKPTIDRLTLQASIAREKFKRSESALASLNKLVASAAVKDDRFTQLTLMANLRIQKEAEMFSLSQLLSALEVALTPPYTQPAQPLEAVFVSEKPVSPKKGLLLVLGLVGGLLVGVLFVFISSAWRQEHDRRSACVN